MALQQNSVYVNPKTGLAAFQTYIQVPDGSAAQPSLVFTSDNNTGFYSPGGSQIGVSINGTSKIFIDSSGRVGIGTGSPSQLLHVNGNAVIGGSPAVQYGELTTVGTIAIQRANPLLHFVDAAGSTRFGYIQHAGTGGDFYILNQETAALRFGTANGEKARIDSAGRLLVGTSTARSNFYGSITPNGIQNESGFGTFFANTTTATGSAIYMGKSRGTAAGSNTVVLSGDQLGAVVFFGADGANAQPGAQIVAEVDGTPGTNDMPGRLVFSTTADGASSPTERMRITSGGNLLVGKSYTSNEKLGIGGGTAAYSTSTSASGIYDDTTVSSAQTNAYIAYSSYISTQAAAFTLSNLTHFKSSQFTIGATSSVTSQYGFFADGTMTGATNNYGFYSNISSGTGRWNFYANGTADSYFASNNFIFANGGTEKARVDSSGRLLMGTSANITSYTVQVVGPNPFDAVRYVATAGGPFCRMAKSRSGTVGSYSIVSADDTIGSWDFAGDDGTAFVSAARISVSVDGNPGVNDMPGRIALLTTPDGSSNVTEQWRITNGGTVVYNQPAPAAVDTTATLTVANLTAKIITSSTAAAVTMTLPTGTLMDAGFSGLYNNMAFEWSVINTGGTNAVTIAAGASHTIVGSATVAANGSGRFASRRTAATTWVTYRVS